MTKEELDILKKFHSVLDLLIKAGAASVDAKKKEAPIILSTEDANYKQGWLDGNNCERTERMKKLLGEHYYG